MEAYRKQKERCIARHFQVCLALKQFDHLVNVTYQLYQSFERVRDKFWHAIDYVEDTHSHMELGGTTAGRARRGAHPIRFPRVYEA